MKKILSLILLTQVANAFDINPIDELNKYTYDYEIYLGQGKNKINYTGFEHKDYPYDYDIDLDSSDEYGLTINMKEPQNDYYFIFDFNYELHQRTEDNNYIDGFGDVKTYSLGMGYMTEFSKDFSYGATFNYTRQLFPTLDYSSPVPAFKTETETGFGFSLIAKYQVSDSFFGYFKYKMNTGSRYPIHYSLTSEEKKETLEQEGNIIRWVEGYYTEEKSIISGFMYGIGFKF